MNTKFSNHLWVGLILFCVTLCVSVPVKAAIYSADVTFETSDQSMWGSGDAVLEDFDYFLGPQWDVSGSAGDISTVTLIPGGCLPWWLGGGCWDSVEASVGAEIRGESNGEVGIDLHADWDTGSVDVTYPVGIELTFPNPYTVRPGDNFTISSSYVIRPGASLTTNFPEAHITADAVFDVFASIGGEICVVGCLGGDFTVLDVDERLNLLDIGPGSSFEVSLPAGTGSIAAAMPDIDTIGSLIGENLHSSGSDTFLSVDIDLDRIATNLLGVPPLSDSFDVFGTTFSYTIVDVHAGVDLEITQDFWFDPDLNISLDLLGRTETFSVGDSISLTMPNYAFDIIPTVWLNNTFTNDTDLDIIPNLSLDVLSVSAGGASFGPVFSESISTTIGVDLFASSFALGGFQSFSLDGFEIVPTPEPGTILLLAAGGFFMALYVRKKGAKS